MKTIKVILFQITALLIFSTASINSQWLYNFSCGMEESTASTSSLFGTGMFKPMKTLPANDTSAYLRVLLVYVEFKDDRDGDNTYWAPENPPIYADDLFAPVKTTGFNAYSDYLLSNHFNKISNDQFDVIGDVKHIILNKEYSEYSGSGNCYDNAMLDVLRTLDTSNNLDYRADWRSFEKPLLILLSYFNGLEVFIFQINPLIKQSLKQ